MPTEAMAAALEAMGPEAVFLRFLLRHTGRAELFAVDEDAVLGGGRRSGVHVVSPWLLGSGPGAERLYQKALEAADVYSLHVAAPVEVRPHPGWSRGDDLVMTCAPRASAVAPATELVSGEALWDHPAVHPALAELFAPPHIRAQFPFRMLGWEHDGQVVSVCDLSVDDGVTVVVQQVHTAPELRGRGLAARLVRAALAEHGSRRAVWVCDVENPASVATARAAGFGDHLRLPRLCRE